MGSLTPRENFIRFFKNEPTQWTPSSRDLLRFNPDILIENIARGAVNEARTYTDDQYGGPDYFGVPWIYVPSERGSMEQTGFTLMDDISQWRDVLTFPDLDKLDWEGCLERNREYLKTDKIIQSTIYTGFFERLISFIGFEEAAIAMIDEDVEEDVRALFERLSDFYIELIERLRKVFGVEYIYFHDDWGSQKSTFFSVGAHENLIVPYLTKVVKAAHEMGVFVEMHSCGCISTLIPNLISTGIDSWRGQPKVNDKLALVKKYGREFKFGVEILAPDHPATDEEAKQIAQEFVDQYAGQTVWVALTRGFTDSQMEMMFDTIYTGLKQDCPC